MAPRRLRWGLVGLGSLAANGIMPAMARSVRCEVTACATRDPTKAREFAARFGIPHAHDDHESLARNPDVDAVFVATPNALHMPAVLAAAAAGKHVLCEKPLALSEAEATRMIDACASAGVMLRLGLHLRFERFLDRVGEVLRSGEIGVVRALSIERAAPPAERVPWREDPEQGGSVLFDVGVHLLDLAPRLLGAPLVAVQGMAFPAPQSGRGADTVTLLAESANAVQVTLRVTREAPRAAADVMALGTAGFLRTGPLRWVPEYVLTVSTPDRVREERAAPCDLYRDELDGFALDLADGDARLGTGVDGLRLVQVAAAVEAALRDGRRVTLPT